MGDLTREHAVVIAGGGPTGTMLAGELALAGIDAVVVERRVTAELDAPRARGIHSRSIEVLDQRGIAERFLSLGQTAQITGFSWIPLHMSDLPTRHPYGLALAQGHIERILTEWVAELAVPIIRGQDLVGFQQHAAGVDAELSGGTRLRAQYLVGCDGGRSLVRKLAGIDFAGWEASTSSLIAEVEMSEEPPWGLHRDGTGPYAFGKAEGGRVAIVVGEKLMAENTEPTLADLSRALIAVCGTDYGLRRVAHISRFTDTARQAAAYRKGRVLLAGDAAHVHSPMGGQGLSTGLQDAVNLGWKLALVVCGTAPESLLDTYHAERHPVGARVLQNNMAQNALIRGDARVDALRDILSEVLVLDQPRQHIAAMMSGLDIRYDLGDGHPLLGRRMPDVDVVTADGATRVFALLREAKPVLLNLGDPDTIDLTGWEGRVQLVQGRSDGPWEIPLLGPILCPNAVLIRPDGHVAWVGEDGQTGLHDALATWFGPASVVHHARPARVSRSVRPERR
jgi:3-(3-hydroxy-phenyl)propionate hydroxylase